MQVGDKIQYIHSKQGLNGVVCEIKGRKWLKVKWADRVILDEHIDDIKLIEKTLDNQKRL